MKSGVCALCKNERELKLSHIIPDFIGRHFKKTSSTGYLRNIVNPNVRVQDLMKEYLLCSECEQRLSTWEKKFADYVFYPFAKRNLKELRYENWLKKFIVSIHWRIGITGLNSELDRSDSLYPFFHKILEGWRRYLLDLPEADIRSKHHIFFIDEVNIEYDVPVEEPDFYPVDSYTFRSLDFSVSSRNDLGNKYLFVWTKLPEGIALVSNIIPVNPIGWENTEVNESGLICLEDQQVGILFNRILEIRCGRIAGMLEESNISQKQLSKIYQDVRKRIVMNPSTGYSKGLMATIKDHKRYEVDTKYFNKLYNVKLPNE